MDKKEIIKLLKEALEIRVNERNEYGYITLEISLLFDGEEICSDSLYVKGDANQI